MDLKCSDLTFVIGSHKSGKTQRLSEVFVNSGSAAWVRDDGMVVTRGCDVLAMVDDPDYFKIWDKWENALGWQSRAYRVIEPILRTGYSLPEGSTLILEHPDAFLDRTARVDLADYLCDLVNAGLIKVIIETHDDLCLTRTRVLVKQGRLKPEQVVINYTLATGKVNHPKIDSDGHIDDWSNGFLEEMNEQLEQLL